jgi:hypothetical protein
MAGMLFVIVALIVLFAGMGGVMLMGTKLTQDHEERMLLGGADPDTVKRLGEAVDALQGQVSDLSDRLDFTERLLQAPRPDDAGDEPGHRVGGDATT